MLLSAHKILLFALAQYLCEQTTFAQTVSIPPQNQEIKTVTTDNNAASNAKPLPDLIIMPWQTLSIDPDMARSTRAARQEATAIVRQIFSAEATDMAALAPKNPAFESARSELKDVLATKTSGKLPSLAIIPFWTKIHDHDLLGIAIVDSTNNTLKTVSHRLLPKSYWAESLRTKSLSKFFVDTLRDVTQKVNLASLGTPKEDLSLVIRNQAVSSRLNEIDRTALALMLSAQVSQEFTVINPLSTELMTTIHGFYGLKNTMRKANREVIARIIYDQNPIHVKLPVKLTLNIRGADAVFGQTLPWSWTEPMTIAAKSDGTMDIAISDRLKKELTTELQGLNRSELPQIAKIKGAWAYVDKGRAWGLQMNDRLVGSEIPGAIKGHVVSYYGPELNLKSPRGWPIHEGAIIYIRKGQKNLKIGQTFTYDSMKVPTQWPPVSSANKP
jgi:hypothetical protein